MQSEWEGCELHSSGVGTPPARDTGTRDVLIEALLLPKHIFNPMRWTLQTPLPCTGK